MKNNQNSLNILGPAQEIPACSAQYGLISARKWNHITQFANKSIEDFFYQELGGAAASPPDLFHPDIQKKLAGADPASMTLYEYIGTQEALLQCLNDLDELQHASLLLVLTCCSELAEWDLMMSDSIGRAAKERVPTDALFLSTQGALLASLDPQDLALYLLLLPADHPA